MLDEDQWKDQLRADLTNYRQEAPKFRVCVVSQGSSKVDDLYAEIQEQLPHLTVKKLTGKDGGETKKQFLEDINETLEDTNALALQSSHRSRCGHHSKGEEGLRDP